MRRMKKAVIVNLFIAICLFVFATCASCAPTQEISFKGNVTYVNLEGGFWGILSDDGKKYDPINLPEEYKREGLRVQVAAVVKNVVSIHMWGAVIEITAIHPDDAASSLEEGGSRDTASVVSGLSICLSERRNYLLG